MEFELNEEQLAVAESANAVFAGLATPDLVADSERSADRFDARLWAALANANLLGLALPESFGGAGLGLTELCLVLEVQGRHVAPVPLWATTVLGAMPLAHFGLPEQKERWLPGVASGTVKLTAALTEVAAAQAAGATTSGAAVNATRRDGGWVLHGMANAVPQAHLAERVLLPAETEDGPAVFLIDPRGEKVTLSPAETTDRQVHPHLQFEDAPASDADVVVGPGRGAEAVDWILERARTGLCAIALGVCEEAVRRTASYLNERQQFGRPLSSFQATMLRAADAFIDTEAIRVTLWNAAWRLDTGRPATEEVAAAKWWASEAGQRVVHATQHLHGGIGADIEFPIHRYFLWGKQIELMLGAPSAELARLGMHLGDRLKSAS